MRSTLSATALALLASVSVTQAAVIAQNPKRSADMSGDMNNVIKGVEGRDLNGDMNNALKGIVGRDNTQQSMDGNTFNTSPLDVIKAAAPAWHFDEKTCAPCSGKGTDGGMNPGLNADHCNQFKTNEDCPKQPPKNGQHTEAADFPTYYYLKWCPDDKSWRAVYDVYFPKDTGHKHDWEFAVVNWVDDGTNQNKFVRDGVWYEQDGKKPYQKWSDLPNTYNDDTDIDQDGAKGKNRPKLYFGKWHHSVHGNAGGFGANTCPATSDEDYRSDDYRYDSQKNLVDSGDIPISWNYGTANSPPGSFAAGETNDVCKFSK